MHTEYLVQTSKNQGSYNTRYTLTSETQAYMYYKMINIGRGYNKRLIKITYMPYSRKVIERDMSR